MLLLREISISRKEEERTFQCEPVSADWRRDGKPKSSIPTRPGGGTVYAADLKSAAARLVSSNLTPGTNVSFDPLE